MFASKHNNDGTGSTDSSILECSASDFRDTHHLKPTQSEKETQKIRAVRVIAIFGIFCAIPLSLGVFMYTSNAEEQDFAGQYEEFARKILEAIGATFENSFGALDNLAVTVVASAHAMNQSFPNYRVEDFAVRAAKTLSLSKAKVIVTCPLVTAETFDSWTNWTSQEGRRWVDETIDLLKTDPNFYGPIIEEYSVLDQFYNDGTIPIEEGRPYLPSWQAYPIIPSWPPYNFDYITGLPYTTAHTEMLEKGTITITNPYLNPDPSNADEVALAQDHADWLSPRIHPDEEPIEPASDLYFPIRDNVKSLQSYPALSSSPVVATFAVSFYWRDMIRDILPESAIGILLVVENPCSASFTYRLDGRKTTLLGRGDLHDKAYNHMELESLMTELGSYRILESTYTGPELNDQHCPISFKIFPSSDTEGCYKTTSPYLYSGVTILVCLSASILFLVYDRFQERRQKMVMESAKTSDAVVSSLFPAAIRQKLLDNHRIQPPRKAGGDGMGIFSFGNAPIAELYTDTTVSFADIAGFTAWASTREASDVFTLLESIYFEFDILARKHRVFKVETVGDCYVAVCGLPEPRKLHAVAMAQFCADCRTRLVELTRELATTLGPGTESLRMRYGLNSGPTTAGVLRGDRSRFQLFGDTANTAARMESTSVPNRIQASQKTADLLIEAGKESWLSLRENVVNAKGKGRMATYWVEPGGPSENPHASPNVQSVNSRLLHLINFNVEVLENLMKDLVAHNISTEVRRSGRLGNRKRISKHPPVNPAAAGRFGFTSKTPREELMEVIPIPQQTKTTFKRGRVLPKDVVIPEATLQQIRSFVTTLAHRHNNDNPFHNFDHATHVAMSVRKLLARILKPLQLNHREGGGGGCLAPGAKVENILKTTYMLTSNPMIQFAVYFSALIHDADHPGVSNLTLSKEGDEIARRYGHKSCAEQHSVSVGWDLFMSKEFDGLRDCMFANDEQLCQFRQLVVNAVMATDIFDTELKTFRERRWNKAFARDDEELGAPISTRSLDREGELRATLVIEHIIQASDVVHTMQHWTVYQKWNQRLFTEMRAAFKAGRTDRDPAEGWYKGELWFFDNYVIPLAKKLKECGVFGVSCDEVLDYAQDNRMEWEQKGHAIVEMWVSQEDKASNRRAGSTLLGETKSASTTESESSDERAGRSHS